MTGSAPRTERCPDRAAFIIAAGLAAFGAVLLREGLHIPDKGGYSGVGPGDVPLMIGGGLVILSVWTFLAGLRGRVVNAHSPQATGPILWILAGLALQLVLLHVAGFSIASGLLFACTAAAFGKRNLALTLPTGFLVAFLVYGVFDRLLQLNLPAGLPETLIYGG